MGRRQHVCLIDMWCSLGVKEVTAMVFRAMREMEQKKVELLDLEGKLRREAEFVSDLKTKQSKRVKVSKCVHMP